MPIPDVIVVGGGLIGLATARELQRRGLRVTLLERGRVGQEASWAGAGMLAAMALPDGHALRPLATASAALYPDFIAELRAETGMSVELGQGGTLALTPHDAGTPITSAEAKILVPGLVDAAFEEKTSATFLRDDHYVDNRQLLTALRRAVELRGVRIEEECSVRRVLTVDGACSVETNRGVRSTGQLVIAAGAWAGEITTPAGVYPVQPRKGQMVGFRPSAARLTRVLVAREVYLVPRRDGRVLAGATLEDVGFNRTVLPEVTATLRGHAMRLLPALAAADLEESWAGFRPGTPDGLPLLGEGQVAGLWLATGHFRDGILLTPVTAAIMGDLLTGETPGYDLTAFRPDRFFGASTQAHIRGMP
ncbi:MAG: glycine oxidase ThiO [Terriglobales bacterium]